MHVANAGIAIGAKRTARTVGWCTQVYTEPLFIWFGKTGTGNGVFSVPTITRKWQASLANSTLFTQGFAVDAKQPGGLALTQGVQTTIPPMPIDTRTSSRVFTIQGTLAPIPTPMGLLSEGGALATRFQHK